MKFPFPWSKPDKGKKQEKDEKVKLLASNLPGIDDSLVIPGHPYIMKENSSKEQHFIITLEKPY